MATHSSVLPGESPWTEEPVGYSPWGCKESDMTEWLSTAHLVSMILLFFFVLFSRYYWNGEIEEATEILLVSEAGGMGP